MILGLPYRVSEEDVKRLVGRYGQISAVREMVHTHSGRATGRAVVVFASATQNSRRDNEGNEAETAEVEPAVMASIRDLNGTLVDGRMIRVNRWAPPPLDRLSGDNKGRTRGRKKSPRGASPEQLKEGANKKKARHRMEEIYGDDSFVKKEKDFMYSLMEDLDSM